MLKRARKKDEPMGARAANRGEGRRVEATDQAYAGAHALYAPAHPTAAGHARACSAALPASPFACPCSLMPVSPQQAPRDEEHDLSTVVANVTCAIRARADQPSSSQPIAGQPSAAARATPAVTVHMCQPQISHTMRRAVDTLAPLCAYVCSAYVSLWVPLAVALPATGSGSAFAHPTHPTRAQCVRIYTYWALLASLLGTPVAGATEISTPHRRNLPPGFYPAG